MTTETERQFQSHLRDVENKFRAEVEAEHEDDFNDGHILEGMDRCHTIMIMIEELLSGHPAVSRAGAESEVSAALSLVMTAYQKIGALAAAGLSSSDEDA